MGFGDLFGDGVITLLLVGLAWRLGRLMAPIAKEPKRNSRRSIFPDISFPFLPLGKAGEGSTRVRVGGKLAWQPVRVKHRRHGL